MKKKIISILSIILVIVAILLGTMVTYAKKANDALVVKLAKMDSGVGYAVFNPNIPGGKYIWNFVTANGKQRNLYCVRAEYGTTWESSNEAYNQEVTYDFQYDLEKDIAEISTLSDPNGVIANLLATGESGIYEEVMWLLDNLYIPGTTNKDKYLENIGVLKDEQGYYYIGDDGIKYDYDAVLTDADIIAVQKVAIWKFTNGGTYNLQDETAWLHITTGILDEDNKYKYEALNEVDGKIYKDTRNKQANLLYNYLVTSAISNGSQYVGENKITIDTTNLDVEVIDNKTNYILETKIINGKYVTGPIKISKTNEGPFNVELNVTDSKGNISYTFVDEAGIQIANATIENLIVSNNEFYISTDIIKDLNIAITVTPTTRTKTLWLAGTESNGVITLAGEQPIVEVTSPESTTTNFIVKPFDLALRKYITAVKSGDTTTPINTRVPNYSDLAGLKSGADSTATYKHRKDPIEVKDGDVVTYTLAIYNEGSIDGYATKIVDQLPEGLIWNNESASTVTSSKENTYTISYDKLDASLSQKNQITLTINDKNNKLEAYTGGNELDSETITLECIVATTKLTSQNEVTLTNVAWIAEACDSEGNTVIDRDSQPETTPSVDKDNMSDYRGTTSGNELSDSNYFYKGQQDDDDFEKLVVRKKFDLALVKFITAISKDTTIEDSEYLKDADGRYSREPDVKIDANTGKIVYDFSERGAKETLTVDPGDYVLYTIRVYNEGDIDGYVNMIKDTLPKGLKFVDTATINTDCMWKLAYDSEEREVVTTTWFGKGQGAEEGATVGSPNYEANLLKAFDKENGISNVNPDYLDAYVLCQVVEQDATDEILVNYAQISADSDDDTDSTPDEWIDEEDDQDIEKVKIKAFDLSLRKFITAVNETELKDNDEKYIRAPKVNTKPLKDGEDTAVYEHSKQPVAVQPGDKVVYTIRVYNEGDIDGFASKVTDYLPPYLTYIEDSAINKTYGWQLSEDKRVVTTTYLSSEEFKLTAFDSETENAELDYADVQIECLVSKNVPVNQNQTNIAEISEYKYDGKIVATDRDSTSNNMVNKEDTTKSYLPSDEELPAYKADELNKLYVPGNEDDDDFEKVYVKNFDLALRKFITKVQQTEVTTRVPQPKIENGTISYEHTKEPLIVHVGDVVIYTLRIYNEGEISGYATEITDDIPEYLEYLPEDSTNVTYLWKMYDKDGNETEKVEDAVSVKTEYLSDSLINAFDGATLDYKDIQIAFRVKDPNSNTYIITNHAQITEDLDENKNPVDDNDSDTEAWVDGEDDQDIENVKVEYFDLALLKFVSKVIIIEDGKQKISETGYNGHEDPEPVVKVELHKKKLNSVVVKFGYGITITNEGDIAGYATELTDYIPEGLKFDPNDNPEWTDEGNNVISTRQLEGTLLQPGESKTVEVILTWINGKDNLALKTNTAEISEDKNEYDVPDKDSTPDNEVDGEDDIDIAKVILNISTGAAKTYFMLTLGLLAVVLVGVVLIKKFVI